MRLLHSAALLRPMTGIVQQMNWESEAAKELGLDWDVKLFCPSEVNVPEDIKWPSNSVPKFTPGSLKSWLSFRREYYSELKKLSKDYDALLLRYYVHDPFQLSFLKRCRVPCFLVHHSFEVAELGMGGSLTAFVRSNLEKVLGPQCIRSASGVIGVTKEITEHQLSRSGNPGLHAFQYPNGVFMDSTEPGDSRLDLPELLFVAGDFVPWHGLDLLIESIKGSGENFVLHLVGDITEEHKRLIGGDSRIINHGFMGYEDIKTLAERCWISLSSFALFRKGMTEACTLKVRESFLFGLPVYSGHRDVFPEDFEYYRHGPCEISEILNFANFVRHSNKMEVKLAAKPYLDKRALTQRLFNQIEAAVQN